MFKNNISFRDAVTDDVDHLVVDVAVGGEANLSVEWVKEVSHELIVGGDSLEDLGKGSVLGDDNGLTVQEILINGVVNTGLDVINPPFGLSSKRVAHLDLIDTCGCPPAINLVKDSCCQ